MAFSEGERNDFIQESLSQGMSLSELQDQLAQRFGIHMTYMELRMLTSELQVNWEKQDEKAVRSKGLPDAKADATPTRSLPPEEDRPDAGYDEAAEPVDETTAQDAPAKDEGVIRGKTTVEVSKVVRPGAALSGKVSFGSGASGEWYLDQYGRIGFTPDEGSANPDQQDAQEFQSALQAEMQKMGY